MQKRVINWAVNYSLYGALSQPFRRWPLWVIARFVEARYVFTGRF